MVKNLLTQILKKRLAKKYSQDYVASRLKISQSSYNKIENGTTQLTVAMLLQISVILDLEYLTTK
jgi:transcriptional regulator with XRE-family HTH domain